jgi:hypothetical protein
MMSAADRPAATLPPVASAAEAVRLAAQFAEVMQALIATIDEETALVRAGRAREASTLERRKTDLARQYLADAARVKEAQAFLRQHAPDLLRQLQERHDRFRAVLQINLTVLATAHAVAEGLVRGVSGELARKSAPQTYTAYGRNAAAPRSAPPMVVSRQL